MPAAPRIITRGIPFLKVTFMLGDRIHKRFSSLTFQQKTLAKQILSIDHEAAFFTISQLARQFKTSESTIVRFARAIGYKGYPDLQKDLRNDIRKKLSPPYALRKSMAKKKGRDIYSDVFEIDLENIRKTRELNDHSVIDQAVQQIIRARKIGFTGFRSSHSVAYLLYFFIGQVQRNCELLDCGLGSLPNQILNYGPQDLLIGISLPRYFRQILDIMKYAKGNKCQTIAITDSPISPLGQVADLILLAGNQSSTYFNSLVGVVALINCLVAGVSLRNGKSFRNLSLVNKVAEKWNYHIM
jgi:DNA-binding MurR/RpiR family transcriptional regulator